MKKVNYLIVLAVLISWSCSDLLEIEPKSEIPSEQALSKGSNVELTLTSAYAQLVSDNFLGKNVRLYSELMSDNIGLDEISFNATDFTGQVALRNTNVLNKDVDALWQTGYRAIARANAVIGAVDNNLIIDDTSPLLKSEWRAEALFIRAVAHFELLRLFALPYSSDPTTDLGIPIRIKPLTTDEKVARSTVDKVYEQVIADLTAAIADLPESNGNLADKWAARGYLARVFFNKLDYQNALQVSTEIINHFGSLSGNALTPFRNAGNIPASGAVLFQVVSGGNAFNDFRPSQRRYSINKGTSSLLYDLSFGRETDYRFNNMVVVDGERHYSLKWDNNQINPPIIRLAEIYLINAESAARLANPDLAVASDGYNAVRQFSDPTIAPVNFASAAEALDSLVVERRVEMAFEGDRYHELKRLKSASFGEVKSGSTIIREAKSFDDASWLLKIPVSETSGNPLIVQN